MLDWMDTYAKRLKWALSRAAMSQSDLARAINVRPQSIQHLCDEGKNARGSKHNSSIANALNVSASWLETGRGDPLAADRFAELIGEAENSFAFINAQRIIEQERGDYNVTDGPMIRGEVPLISWVQAGEWGQIVDNFQPGDAEEWIGCPTRHGIRTFALRVSGISMEPRYQHGDIIFVDPDAAAEHGKNVVVRLDDDERATFKQLVVDGDKRYLRPLNPDWPGPKLIEINGRATICGVVIGKYVQD